MIQTISKFIYRHFIKILSAFLAIYTIFVLGLHFLLRKKSAPLQQHHPLDTSINEHADAIVIKMDAAPGSGNQVSNFRIMKKLRELGYSGLFRVVYPRGSSHAIPAGDKIIREFYPGITKEKILRLAGLPKETSDHYYDPVTHVEYINTAHYLKHVKNPISFAISSGSYGDFCYDLACDDFDISEGEVQKQLPCNDNAKMLQADVYLTIPSHKYMQPVDVRTARNSSLVDTLWNSSKLFFKFFVESFADAEQYLMQHPQLFSEKPGLKTWMDQVRSAAFYLLPAYGLHLQYTKGDSGSVFPALILEMMLGARLAQLHPSGIFQDKPIVIPVFYPYEIEMEKIKHYLNNPKDIPAMFDKFAEELIRDTKAAADSVFINLHDQASADQLNALRPNQLAIVSMGSWPEAVFNGLYLNDGKQVLVYNFEGEGTRNMVISATPRPYLHSTMSYYFEVRDNPYLVNRFANFAERCQWVSQFIMASQNSSSPESCYFAEQHQRALLPENDRILAGIKAAMRQFINIGVTDVSPSLLALFDKVDPETAKQFSAKAPSKPVYTSSATRPTPFSFIKNFWNGAQSYFSSDEKPIMQGVILEQCQVRADENNVVSLQNWNRDYHVRVFSIGVNEKAVMPTAMNKSASLQGDTYSRSSCRAVEYNGKPSVYCEGERTTMVYTPTLSTPPLQNLDGHLGLLAISYYWVKSLAGLVTQWWNGNPRVLSDNVVHSKAITSNIETLQKELAKIKNYSASVHRNGKNLNKTDRQWVEEIIETCIPEWEKELNDLMKNPNATFECIRELHDEFFAINKTLVKAAKKAHYPSSHFSASFFRPTVQGAAVESMQFLTHNRNASVPITIFPASTHLTKRSS